MFTGQSKDTDIETLLLLSDNSITQVCKTNTYLRDLCRDQDFWRRLIGVRFPSLDSEVLNKYKGSRSWSDYYIEDLRPLMKKHREALIISLINNSRLGRLDKVIIAKQLGVKINALDNMALYHASEAGHLDVVKYLIENGADPTADDFSAIKSAIVSGHIDVASYLMRIIEEKYPSQADYMMSRLS